MAPSIPQYISTFRINMNPLPQTVQINSPERQIMLISINPRKAFSKANFFARVTYLTFILQGIALLVFALTRGSLFGGKASIVVAILDVIAVYLVIDTGLLFLRGKANGVKVGLVISLLTGVYYTHALHHSSMNIVGLTFSVSTIFMLLLPQSRKHIEKKPKKSMVAPKPEC